MYNVRICDQEIVIQKIKLLSHQRKNVVYKWGKVSHPVLLEFIWSLAGYNVYPLPSYLYKHRIDSEMETLKYLKVYLAFIFSQRERISLLIISSPRPLRSIKMRLGISFAYFSYFLPSSLSISGLQTNKVIKSNIFSLT